MKNGKIINLILFSLFCILCVASAYFLYLNIDKNSKLLVEQNEVAIRMLSFDELPKNERDKYIKKDNLDAYGKFLTPRSYERNLNISSVSEPIPDDLEELKRQVSDLRVQNKLLYDDNVDLANKNLEIANMLNSKQNDSNKQSVNLRDIVDSGKNLETINELTKKLEETQSENLQNSKLSSQKIVELQNEIDSLKDDMSAKLDEFEKEKSRLLEKNSDEISKNLKTQIDERSRLEKELLKVSGELSKLKDENSRLIDNLSLKESEVKRIATEQNDKISKIQIASEDEIGALRRELEAKKNEYEKEARLKLDELENLKKELSLAQNDSASKIKELEAKLLDLNLTNEKNTKFKVLSEEQNSTIEQLRSRLQRERESFQKEVMQMWSLHKSEVEKLKNQFDETVSNAQSAKSDFESKIAELTEENLQKDELISRSESNITSLNAMLNSQKERLESEISSNKKNIQNYKILNDKITSLIQSNAIINKEAKKRVDDAETETKNYKLAIDELNLTIANKDMQIKDAAVQIDRLKSSLDAQIKKNEALIKSAQGDKKNPLSAEVAELKRQISELMQDGEYLSNENENLKKIIQLNFKTEVPKKVVFIASIECDDMSVGSDKPTVMCKNRVSEFLQRYNSNYYFEIIPIVSHGNFIATSKAAQAIPKHELDKINSYANFGIGKERAKTAGELVKDEFGDFSRISYSNEIITSNNKQGFVIKVYR